MGLDRRSDFYKEVDVDDGLEYDYLSSNFHLMNLETIAEEKVSETTIGRLDLISFKHYRSYHYGWLILEHNGIIDPLEEIELGMVLAIPSIESFFRFKSRNKRS